jgi:hypothetical protein
MSKIFRILFVTIMVSMFLTTAALADATVTGPCPPDFMLHMAHEHDEHHTGHLHAGTDADQNGDGFICVRHLLPDESIHVHIDNNVKLGVNN